MKRNELTVGMEVDTIWGWSATVLAIGGWLPIEDRKHKRATFDGVEYEVEGKRKKGADGVVIIPKSGWYDPLAVYPEDLNPAGTIDAHRAHRRGKP